MFSTPPWEDMLKMIAIDAADFLSKTTQESADHCTVRRELRKRNSNHPLFVAETEVMVKENNYAEVTPAEKVPATK